MRDEFQQSACIEGGSDQKLAGFLRDSTALIGSLDDPEYRHCGYEFIQRLQSSGCHEVASLTKDPTALALYTSFNPRCTPAFVNLIAYPMTGSHNFAGFCLSRVHEGNHAIAWAHADVLQASPCNDAGLVKDDVIYLLCPEDFALMFERTEQDTYAKQGWIASLMAQQDPVFYEASKYDAVTAREFESLRADNNLPDALAIAAQQAMKKWHSQVEGVDKTFAEHYHQFALEIYEICLRELKSTGRAFKFVRLEASDIAAMGDTFGPNIFESHAVFLERPVFNASNAALCAKLNQQYGILNRNELPSYQEIKGATARIIAPANNFISSPAIQAQNLCIA